MSYEDCNKGVCFTKFQVFEDKMAEFKATIDGFDGIKEVLVELKLLTAQQIEVGIKRDAMAQEQGIVSAKTVSAIEQLSSTVYKTEGAVEVLNKRFIEKDKEGVIKINDVVKSVILLIIGAVTSAIVAGVIK